MDSILRKLSKENGGIVKDVQVLPFNVALKEEIDDDIILSLQLSSLLKSQQDNFPIYKAMFVYPAFIQEIISFSKECILYDITSNDLPSSNPNEEELKRIMDIALSLDYTEKINKTNKPKTIDSIKNNPNITLSYQFINDKYHYDIFKELSKSIAYTPYPTNNPSLHLKYALNARSEAEAIVQNICLTNKPSNIILTDATTQLPLYESVLTRYNIPFSSLKEKHTLRTPFIYKALVMFSLKKDKDTLLECIKLDAFSKQANNNVYAFLNQTLTSTSLPDDISDLKDSDIFKREIEQHLTQYAYAKEYYDSIKDEIDLLLNTSSFKQMLYNAFHILRNNPVLKETEEFNCASQIRTTVIQSQDFIQDEQDIIFLTRAIENFKVTYQTLESDFVVITDIRHPVEPKENAYVVSVNGSNYPGVPTNQGLFDERYTETISKYPSQQERYDMYMSQLDWINHSSINELTYSYYTNDYQGREVQLAFDIENKFKPQKASKWDLVSLTSKKPQEHVLDPSIAKQLFTSDNRITGSISTIERWFMCQYSYFIQSGLEVREKQVPSIDASSIGQIQHKLLEDSFKENNKQYANINEEKIREYIEPSFEVLNALHPNRKEFTSLTKERMVTGIQSACAFLSDFEKHTSFNQKEAEYHFHEHISEHVTLKGIIDRLDTYQNELVRIIDYKSSSKTLSADKIKAGVQLQLLSYLIIASKMMRLKPAGSYYYSLKSDNIDTIAKKKVKDQNTKEELISDTLWDTDHQVERMINSRQLSGWTYLDHSTELDENGEHIKSLNTQYDFDKVQDCILKLYELFYTQLTEGNISINPTDDACMFCKYKSICRYHGDTRKATPLLYEDDNLKVGKE